MAKTLLEARDIRLSFGAKNVLNVNAFTVMAGEKIGLVGENGAGKTTFLRVLAGEIGTDAGQIVRRGTLAYLPQEGAGEADAEDARLKSLFNVQPDAPTLSGGERERRRVASALSQNASLLLLDEPTSNLDGEGAARLLRELAAYDGAMVLVTHDRALLDALVSKIAELEDGKITLYPGNYTQYRAQKDLRRDFERFEYEQYRREQARLLGAIQGKREQAQGVRNAPKRMGKSEARLHKRGANEAREQIDNARSALQARLSHLEEKPRVREDGRVKMALGACSPIPGKTALEIANLDLGFPGRPLLTDASLILPTGARMALTGPNGCGKTTLLSAIAQGHPAVRLSPAARMGVFGQDHERALDLSATALENASSLSNLPQSDVRTILARLRIRGDEALKPASLLSGGEKAKVCLARLLAGDCNLLVLDEPTNYLDVFALEALEELLCAYRGTLLFVSHDARFARRVATCAAALRTQKLVTAYKEEI